jgi:hypothetical protein
MKRRKKRRASGDVPTRDDMQDFAKTLGNFMDERGMRTPTEKRFIERIREGVKRRIAKDEKP